MKSNSKFSPFDTSEPNPLYRKKVTHPLPVSKLWGDIKKPYPTNAWWLNLIHNNGDQTLNTYPYISKAKTDQLCIRDPNFIETQAYVLSNYYDEWCIKFQNVQNHKIISFDEITVNLQYTLESGSVTFPFAQGSPFIVAEYSNSNLEMVTINAILNIKDQNGKSYNPNDHPTLPPSSKFILQLNNNHYWFIYFDKDVNLTATLNSIALTNAFTGVMKLADSEKEEAAHILDIYRNAYAISGNVDYTLSGDYGRIIYQWKTKGTGELLMLTMPHHVNALYNPRLEPGISYRTIKGTISGVIGSQWNLDLSLAKYLWDSLNQIDSTKLPDIKTALANDYNKSPGGGDPYFFGVEIGRLAKLALIADQIRETEKASIIRSNMEKAIEPWLLGTNTDALLYDTTYGGIVSTDGIKSASSDFGNGYYNDHHFHYGYHILACAVIGRKNPNFIIKYKNSIVTYARDYANPSTYDQYFPVTRHKDWFTWHSWAAGLYEFADGRNQESTSEALMSYYGLMLLGEALQNQEMKKFGRLLLAMEIQSAKTYWHMPSKSKIYPDIFEQNRMVGVLWANKVDYATFFWK